ncbi:MAG: hypothetical protein HY901_28860 [Deltaproteobacteria bacterium]|nr:hypothetical protein [Deltaproteobacteria bacterium]
MLDRLTLLGLALAGLVGGFGCAVDECERGTARCLGNVAERCEVVSGGNELSSHARLFRSDCGEAHCVVARVGGSSTALCALAAAPDPVCPAEFRDEPEASRCLLGSAVTWSYGFRTRESSCRAPSTCADARRAGFGPGCPRDAFCTSVDGPEPLCGPGVATFCDGATTIVHCQCGFRRDAHVCASPGPRCVLIDVAKGAARQGACREMP